MAGVVIGVDPHKASHTAVAIDAVEQQLGEVRVRASAAQVERLLAWAATWPVRTWAVEGTDGTGHLLAQQLLAAGEQVLDMTRSPRPAASSPPSWWPTCAASTRRCAPPGTSSPWR